MGNSSTVPRHLLSHSRLALRDRGLTERLFQQYVSNHIYVYPEDRDHDPKRGDVFPANTPYLITSQGSSGSDRPFVRAIAAILAAFRPDVKNHLRDRRLVMPTVQMILRRGQKSIVGDEDYLSGRAHPSVFVGTEIDPVKMVKLANRLTVAEIPPIVHLEVVEESMPEPNVELFGPRSEKLFDMPAAIARVVRSTAYEKRLVVSAAKTKAGGQQALHYHWVVLRGDAERIRITPRAEDGSAVEIVVPWHERGPIAERPELTTDRVDIGVFVYNGAHYSAPSFISLLYSGHQKREYDDHDRIVSIDYRAADYAKRYVDPQPFPDQAWRDFYDYDSDGQLLGWRRVRSNGEDYYTRHGARVVERDSLKRPVKARVVRYQPKRKGKRGVEIIEKPTKKFLTYRYGSDADRFGALQ